MSKSFRYHPAADRLASADTNVEIIEVMKEVENVTTKDPERSAQFSRFIVPLFASQSSSIRKNAYNSALAIISANPKAADQLLTAYQTAILSTDKEISKHAISYLPHFVANCSEMSDALVQSALQAVQLQLAPNDSHIYISQAIDVIKKSGLAK